MNRLINGRAAGGGLCRYGEGGAGDSSLDSDRRPDGRRCVYRPGVDPARQDGGYAIIVRHSGRDGVPGRDPFPIVEMEDVAAGKFGNSVYLAVEILRRVAPRHVAAIRILTDIGRPSWGDRVCQ